MQVYLDFIDELVLLVNLATNEKKQNTSLTICRNLYPYYRSFARKEDDATLVSNAIAFCEQEFAKPEKDTVMLNQFMAKIEKLMPNNPEAQTWKESYAMNALSAVHELLMFTKNSDNQHVIDICSLLIDNVDFEINDENEDINDDQIYEHPKMISTMAQIKEMLQ
ncbi:MAG: DUF416 family protein [Bacteroidales bacterium]